MYYKDKLICGLQIKPTSYLTSDFEYIRRAHRCNDEKNLKYQQKFGVPVITITSEMSGIPTSHLEMLKLNKFDRELL